MCSAMLMWPDIRNSGDSAHSRGLAQLIWRHQSNAGAALLNNDLKSA